MVCKNLRECRSFDVTIIWNSEEVLYVRAKKKKKREKGSVIVKKKQSEMEKGRIRVRYVAIIIETMSVIILKIKRQYEQFSVCERPN